MNTTEKWGGHDSLEKCVNAVSAGAEIQCLTPDELVELIQRMIASSTEAEAEKYQDALVAGFYGKPIK